MAYKTIKQCASADCNIRFNAHSNAQLYCKSCAKIRRASLRPKWNNTYNKKVANKKNAESRTYNKSEKGRAAQKLRDAIRQGKLNRQPCEVCHKPSAQGHHTDYSKPYDVKWLCPQHHREEHLFEPWQNELRRAGYNGGFELSQLIEACGKDFLDLKRAGKDLWVARGFDSNNFHIFSDGPTPTEAVARLWLALQK